MSYDLSPQVIEPRRKAFDYLVERFGDREASRYEEGTLNVQSMENFHYRPLWNREVEIFDPAMTRLKLEDWYAFLDPRQYYYGAYNMARSKTMEVLDAELTYAKERGLLERVGNEWRDILLAYLVPLRHYEYGATTTLAYVGRFAYGTSISQCASFNTFDKMGNSQIFTKLCLMLPEPDKLLEQGKEQWLEAEHLQPLRALVERSWIIQDWAEVLVLQNLLLEPLLYGLLYDQFDRVVLDNGIIAISFIDKYLLDWFKDNSRWTNQLFEVFGSEARYGTTNQTLLQEMVDKWAPQVVEAIKPFRKIFEMPQRAGNFEASFELVLQTLKTDLESLGLALSDKASAPVAATTV